MLDSLTERGPNRLHGGCEMCFGDGRVRLCLLTSPTAPKKVDAAIVSDTKQPRRDGSCIVECVELPVRLEECLLDDILPIQHGARHACAVAMQTRTQMRDCLEEREVAGLDATSRCGLVEGTVGGREISLHSPSIINTPGPAVRIRTRLFAALEIPRTAEPRLVIGWAAIAVAQTMGACCSRT